MIKSITVLHQKVNFTEAVVLSRAMKANGKNKGWFNEENRNDRSAISTKFDVLDSWKKVNHKSKNVLINDHNDQAVINAKNIEIKNWKDFNVYEVIENQRQPTISTIWVITNKDANYIRLLK